MDEISISGKSLVWGVNENGVSPPYEISPQYFGFKSASLTEIKGGTPEENAEMLRRILDGARGPLRDVVVMNAAAAMVASNRATDLKEGAHLAEEAIDSERAREKFNALVKVSQGLG
jgi:anthranilate phosphoribosyltransferase